MAAGSTRSVSLARDSGVREAYAAHGGELYRFALRALGDTGAAQDVVQETFVRAWRAADRFDLELASLRVWLFAIAGVEIHCNMSASVMREDATGFTVWDADGQPVLRADL